MKIQFTTSELTEILSEHIDKTVVQYTVNPNDISKITANCDPSGEVESLFVYLDMGTDDSSHYQSDDDE